MTKDTSRRRIGRCEESALDGAFEAHQINGLWYYNPARSTEIATALRLKKRGAPQTDRQLVAEATAEAAA